MHRVAAKPSRSQTWPVELPGQLMGGSGVSESTVGLMAGGRHTGRSQMGRDSRLPQLFSLLLMHLFKAFGSVPPPLLSQLIWGKSSNIKSCRNACWLMLPTNGMSEKILRELSTLSCQCVPRRV